MKKLWVAGIIGIIIIAGVPSYFYLQEKNKNSDLAEAQAYQSIIANIQQYGGQILNTNGTLMIKKLKDMRSIAWQDSQGKGHLSIWADGVIVSDTPVQLSPGNVTK